MLISWRKNIFLYIISLAIALYFLSKEYDLEMLSSDEIVCRFFFRYCKLPPSRLSSPFLGQWGGSRGGSTWHNTCLFTFYWGRRYLYCVQFIAAVVTPCVSGSAAAFRLYSGILLALRFSLFHWHYSWWNQPLVSLAAGPLPSRSNWKPFLVAWAGPCVRFHPSLHLSSAWCQEEESERALHFASTSLLQLLARDSSLPPGQKCVSRELIVLSLAVVNGEGQWSRAGESF